MLVKKSKRILAMILVLFIALSMPFSAFAEAGNDQKKDAITEDSQTSETGKNAAPGNAIIAQPQDAAAYLNDTAAFSVEVTGKVKSYKWQYSSNGKKWSNVSAWYGGKTDTIKITASEAYENARFRCIVTWRDGQKSTSSEAGLTITEKMPAYPQMNEKASAGNTIVSVNVPEGALPEGTSLEVSEVSSNEVEAIIETSLEKTDANYAAVDISFTNDGKEVEPEDGYEVEVTATIPGISQMNNPVLYHITDDGVMEPVENAVFDGDIVTFANGSFSVYVVVDGGTGDKARVEVNFYGIKKSGAAVTIDTDPLATYYVKNGDELLGDGERVPDKSYIEDIVSDPGIGETLPSGVLFLGWYIGTSADYTTSTAPKTIDQVREYLAGLASANSIKEGDKVNVYAMVFKVFSVTYLDPNDISLGSDNMYLGLNENSIAYTVSQDYTPPSPTQSFMGWQTEDDANISNAVYEGETAAEPYKMGTTMTITGSITFTVDAPNGHWLVFNENGKGATYNAPLFVKDDEDIVQPALSYSDRMVRLGYRFAGWYTERYEDDAVVDSAKEFRFSGKLTTNTTIYAKWDTITNANYVVIYWKQNSAGTGYDFDSSVTISRAVGTAINVSNNASTITVTGAANYTIPAGFKYGHADEGKKVEPEGNTVVNVYIDRNQYKLTFQAPPLAAANTGSSYQSRTVYIFQDTDYYGIQLQSTTLYTRNGKWYSRSGNWLTGYTYTEYTSGVYSSNTFSTVKTIEALYEADVSAYFPIVGTNNVTYNNGERWSPQSNSVGWNEVMLKVMTMPAGNVIFRLDYPLRPLKTMNYYVEALEGESGTAAPTLYSGTNNTIVSAGGKRFVLAFSLSARYNGVTEEDLLKMEGYSFLGVDQRGETRGNTFFYIYSTTSAGTINIYYTRDKYAVTYFDGVYVDGNNNPLSSEDYSNQGQLNVVEDIVFGSSTASYNKGESNYYEAVSKHPGFVLEGWYIDDACTQPYTFTTMPKGGIKVYAKWRQIQYRVFMHPEAKLPDGTNDSTLSWGDEDQPETNKQSMNFRISYGGELSMPTGLRSDYEFIGWYTPEGKPFNVDSKLTEDLVKEDYDKTDPKNYTDKMNKFGEVEGQGYNSDLTGWDHDNNSATPGIDRYWISKKLDLYGKWSAILTGAQGIGIIYDANGGSGAPDDTMKYKDNREAIAQAASTAPKDMRFLYWVIQKWNGTEYEDITVDVDGNTQLLTVYPGEEFTVVKAYAKETELSGDDIEYEKDEQGNFILDEEGNKIPKVFKAYTMQLRAEYGPAEPKTDTYINWYQNEEDVEEPVHKDEDKQINALIPIYDLVSPNRAEPVVIKRGHVFLGWSIQEEYDADQFNEDGSLKKDAVPRHYIPLGEADLTLKYDYENEKYLYKDSSGNWTVTPLGVAADEIKPYEAIYAVWKDVIYIVHGSDKKVEVVDLADTAKERYEFTRGYDAATGKYTGYYYGGYGLMADTTAADPTGFSLTKGGTAATYTGDYNWTRANAQKSDAAFKASTDASVSSAKKRTVGDVFYIKEVPADYLAAPKVATVVSQYGSGELQNVTVISVIDTNIYRAGGINTTKGTFANSFTMTQTNGAKRSANAKDLFGLDGLLIINAWSTDEVTGQELVPYWTTYDTVTVNSNSSRTMNISGNEVTFD